MLLLEGDDGEMMKDRREQHTSRLTSYFAIERTRSSTRLATRDAANGSLRLRNGSGQRRHGFYES